MPHKQYHISRTTNTIYDITERKKYCTTNCFRSSNYIKEQLFTSPLWLREHEEIPEFKLMPSEKTLDTVQKSKIITNSFTSTIDILPEFDSMTIIEKNN